MTTTDQWNDAARKAAEDICDNVWIPDNEIPQFQERISKHFADLREVHNNLVMIAQLNEEAEESTSFTETFGKLKQIKILLADPLVVAAIERSKG